MHNRYALTMLDCLRMQKNLHAWDKRNRQYRRMPEQNTSLLLIQESLADAVCFKIDNVADMLVAGQKGKDKIINVDATALPCVRPPYPRTWFEYSGLTPHNKVARMGVLMVTGKMPVAKIKPTVESEDVLAMEEIADADGNLIHVDITVFRQLEDQDVLGPLLNFTSLLDSKGAVVGHGPETYCCHDSERGSVNGSLAVPLQALGLLHCRNVTVTEKEPPTTINERHSRKHPPMVKFKTLRVTPVARQRDQVSAPGEPGDTETPYHICRGHIKVFDEKPLFGRVKGTFWWGDFARGDRKKGQVIKDYRVTPPVVIPEADATKEQHGSTETHVVQPTEHQPAVPQVSRP